MPTSTEHSAETVVWHLISKTGLFLSAGENRYSSGGWMGLFFSALDAQHFEDHWTGGDHQFEAVQELLDHMPFWLVVTSVHALQDGFGQLAEKLKVHFGIHEAALPRERGLKLLHPITYRLFDEDSGLWDSQVADYWHVQDELRGVWPALYDGYVSTVITPEEHPILCQLFNKTSPLA